jgi:hypothetical protein
MRKYLAQETRNGTLHRQRQGIKPGLRHMVRSKLPVHTMREIMKNGWITK